MLAHLKMVNKTGRGETFESHLRKRGRTGMILPESTGILRNHSTLFGEIMESGSGIMLVMAVFRFMLLE